jgi:FixJ family two-component response regulator
MTRTATSRPRSGDDSGAVDFVEKPFDDEALLAAVEAASSPPRASGPPGR